MPSYQFCKLGFADAIDAKLGRKGTLRKLAAESGVSVSTCHRILKGHEAKLTTYLKLCTWLDCPISNFITYKE